MDLEEATRAQKASHEGATHEEARPEDPKDMRSTEASYLARGLAERVEALAGALRVLEAFEAPSLGDDALVSVGALVALDDEEGAESLFFFVPAGGGERLRVDGSEVQTITPTTPLAAQLLGLAVDETIEARLPKGERELTIRALR